MKKDEFRTSKETATITFLDDDEELLLWECPPDSSDNESRLSVDWQFLKARPFPIFIPRGGVDPVIFSGDDSSVKLCIGGEASLPEFAPFFDPTKIKSRYKIDNEYFELRIMYLKANFTKRKSCIKAYHARTRYDVVFLSHCQYHSFRDHFLYTVDLHPSQVRVMDGKTLHFFPHYQEIPFYDEGGQAYENATSHLRFPLEV